jgi:hypothetical protein
VIKSKTPATELKCVMVKKTFLLISIAFLSFACNDRKHNKVQTSQEISQSISKAKNTTIEFEGKFVDIHKINSREYYLSLQNEKDSIEIFLTMMPLNENEIQLLKKKGNNIRLNYINFYDSDRQKTEKVVKYMKPIYEGQR